MARNVTLEKLLDDYRAEADLSLNTGHHLQTRLSQIKLLQKTQERLFDDYAWPHLIVERQVATQAGQRYYDMPEDINIDRLSKLTLFSDGAWRELSNGISGANYSAFNSDLDERSWPPRCFRIYEDEQIEIWPIPDVNADAATLEGYLKFVGIRNLRPLVAEDDRCDLDGQLIVLHAAAETLAKNKSDKARLILEQANARYARLRGNLSSGAKTKMFVPETPRYPRRMVISQYRPPES